MKIVKDNKGFTMVEIIIALAILALLSGLTIQTVSYISYGNSKKCVTEIDGMLDKVQMETMSKEHTPYLYLYGTDKGYFMVISTTATMNRTGLEAQGGTKVAGANVKIKAKKISTVVQADGSEAEVTEEGYLAGGTPGAVTPTFDYIRIGFKKSTGGFLADAYYETLTIEGDGATTIYMVESTGKHYVE